MTSAEIAACAAYAISVWLAARISVHTWWTGIIGSVLCGDEFAFVQDGTRQGADFRARQQAWYEAELARRAIPFIRVQGSVPERIAQILPHLEKLN